MESWGKEKKSYEDYPQHIGYEEVTKRKPMLQGKRKKKKISEGKTPPCPVHVRAEPMHRTGRLFGNNTHAWWGICIAGVALLRNPCDKMLIQPKKKKNKKRRRQEYLLDSSQSWRYQLVPYLMRTWAVGGFLTPQVAAVWPPALLRHVDFTPCFPPHQPPAYRGTSPRTLQNTHLQHPPTFQKFFIGRTLKSHMLLFPYSLISPYKTIWCSFLTLIRLGRELADN